MSFTTLPILNLSHSRNPETKPEFLRQLRSALLEVGFLYISHTEIEEELIEKVIENGKAFFEIPEEEKLKVQMRNERSFLGYNLLGGEITASKTDWREQIDISTPHPIPTSSDPLYHNLLAPNQWPSPSYLPTFRPVFETYLSKMSKLCIEFTSLIAEAIGLPATAFDKFFDEDQQHKVKIVRYPDISELGVSENRREGGEGDGDGDGNREGNEEIRQGVGPHKDSMLTSYLLQASPHRGLQAQNLRGEWIDCSPIPGTLVVAIGQGLEAVTKGICASTTHRVLSPARGAGARYSIPFFQGVSYDATFDSVDVPEEVRKEKEKWLENIGGERKDDVEFTFVKGKWGHLGEATLYNRCKSHMDVAERWYPDIFKRILEERKGAAQSVGLGLAAESVSDGVPDSVKASEVAVVEAL